VSKRTRRRRSRLLDQVDGILFRRLRSKNMDGIQRFELIERLEYEASCKAKHLEYAGRIR